ncbi:MAG: hypothetical protein AB7E73_16285, partial [Burkholderiales bacterium]
APTLPLGSISSFCMSSTSSAAFDITSSMLAHRHKLDGPVRSALLFKYIIALLSGTGTVVPTQIQ